VVDLACGPGTVTRRLLARFPAARSIAVDVDPVLRAIASASFARDDRVRIVHADLRDPNCLDAPPDAQVDAVLTATALHWLPEAAVQRLYRDLAEVVRPGGVVAHVEQTPLSDLPRLGGGLARVDRERLARQHTADRPGWDAWWDDAGRDPVLSSAAAQRRAATDQSPRRSLERAPT
jgi:SAM-dependent methyltransferase